MTREEILKSAIEIVCKDRESEYGSPENNFVCISSLWNAYLEHAPVMLGDDIHLRPKDVAIMMSLLKVARIATGKFKEDSWIDAIGYLACGGEIDSACDIWVKVEQ